MKVLRPTELAAMLGVTIQTIGRWRRRGALPDPRLIGPNVLGWRRTSRSGSATGRR
jgi:predicted DNA-binding transcriptional regulator AlpA